MMQQREAFEERAHIIYLENLLRQNNIQFKAFDSQPIKEAQPEQQLFKTNLDGSVSYQDIERYKRQMILKEISLNGQALLKKSKVLVVGAGGIGGPAVFYLAGAGVGTIGLIDGDTVDVSNLHRQIIHTTNRVGINKCLSAKEQIQQFNPLVKVETYEYNLSVSNAMNIFKNYDVILDASDNPLTRYLVNDTCIIQKKPLISGSSVGWEGQLSVYGYKNGPCYRCLFPECPKAVKSCNEAGVFGVIPGFIGLLESLEAVKLIIGQGETLAQRMLLIDGLCGTYKTVKLRNRQKLCIVCGDEPTLKDITQFDYSGFVSTCAIDVPPSNKYQNITWKELSDKITNDENPLLIDCRVQEQYSILNLQGFKNIPWQDVKNMDKGETQALINQDLQQNIYIMCRRGIQSRLMCDYLKDQGYQNLYNVSGGINQFAKDYDPNMPLLQ